MSKLQKVCLAITLIFAINESLHNLLNFNLVNDVFISYPWIGNIYAFIFGISAFINILLFKKE